MKMVPDYIFYDEKKKEIHITVIINIIKVKKGLRCVGKK
jgi:hypothetical protein